MDDFGLVPHCYRMLGSVTEAIEVARSVDSYEAATQACLMRGGTRPLPSDVAAVGSHPEGSLSESPEVLWLEPIPDHLTDDHPIHLELIAALQRLPPPARAAHILHHIEGWPPHRITSLLGPIPIPGIDRSLSPDAPIGRPTDDLLVRYRAAFEEYDVPAIVTFFADDAIWEMPPFTSWFRGPRNIGRLISTHCPAKSAGDQILVPIRANGQPAFAVYLRDPVDDVHRAFQLQVLTLTATAIVHAVAFFDLSLFETFHLPDLLTGLPPTPYDPTPKPQLQRHPRH